MIKVSFKYAILFLLVLQIQEASAQLYIPAAGTLYIGNNAVLYSSTDIINEGYLNNQNQIVLNGNLQNTGNFYSNGELVLSGAGLQELSLSGNSEVNNLTVNKPSGEATILDADIKIGRSLLLTKGRLNIANQNIFTNSVSGGSDSSFVFTSGTGKISAVLSPNQQFKFPVGFETFSPVTVQNVSGTLDTFSVRVLQNVLSNGLSGRVINRARVLKTWDIQKKNTNPTSLFSFIYEWKRADASSLVTPTLNHFKSSYWVPQYGNSSYTDTSLNFTSYAGQASIFSIQEYYQSKIQLKAFLQGYYLSGGQLRPALENSGVPQSDPSNSDTIEVALHNPEDGSLAVAPIHTMLHTDGSIVANLPGMAGPYYISLKHRNSIETWSANPVLIDTAVNYDFTTAANKAFGDNQIKMENNIYALYSGDINQDGAIESSDYSKMENDVLAILFGYYRSDLTGDGVVESEDYSLIENNVLKIIFVQKPY